ncbi:hypothetical protein [Capnocytophaga felis]|uniref:Uncharacterized protein n=1 Tax=Capnocytophaga felis TaxID=2267611 RepID=A0A5M4B7W6_9FLAO|nr:hypothetical protein [Capnocytophaga felis]GET45460.1 hypothetical protein RCZ01_07620 [Capnocytophaga felis]GET47377.1 hypothetical protein RCZ02_02080 [Capnocytophaga felis]
MQNIRGDKTYSALTGQHVTNGKNRIILKEKQKERKSFFALLTEFFIRNLKIKVTLLRIL